MRWLRIQRRWRSGWSGDFGRTWHEYPEPESFLGSVFAKPVTHLNDGTIIFATLDSDRVGRLWQFSPTDRTRRILGVLPDSSWVSSAAGVDLASLTLLTSHWLHEDGHVGPALVKLDPQTDVSENTGELSNPDTKRSWFVYDLLGREVLRGKGDVRFDQLPRGAFILRQGDRVLKFLR